MQIGWIGLGNMGAPMSGNLVAAGHEVRGFDPSEAARSAAAELGVKLEDTVAATVADADIVFTMLPNHHVVKAVLGGEDGVLANARQGAVVVDSSTIDIDAARELHETTAAAGLRFLDAPVSGGISGAAAGTLTFMVGGDEAVLEDVRAVIDVMAGRVFYTGGAGNGQAAKLTNNMMLGINLAATAEGAVLAERLGLDASTFWQIAQASSGDSWALRTWYPIAGVVDTAAVNRDFEGGFATALLRKDLDLAIAAGSSTSTALPFATAVRQRMDQLIELGLADQDCSVLVKLVDGELTAPALDEAVTSTLNQENSQ
jgi:3-hydroxyisobutyrate dehydrogenase